MSAEERDFGFMNGEFINLYGDENPILEIDDKCYFLLTNLIDYHRPLLCTGIVQTYKITEGQNRLYYIQLVSILESPRIIKKFVWNKPFGIIPYSKGTEQYPRSYTKKIQFSSEKYLQDRVFPVEAFFVRETEQKCLKLQKDYTQIILNDLKHQINDIVELQDKWYFDNGYSDSDTLIPEIP